MDLLAHIEDWYLANCDGDWEHHRGLTIQTLDNPGWLVEIDLVGTPMEEIPFDHFRLNRSKDDWVDCQSVDGKFQAAGGGRNLQELLGVFCTWVQTQRG